MVAMASSFATRMEVPSALSGIARGIRVDPIALA